MTHEDRQKILAMKKHGMAPADICHRYRHRYQAGDVMQAMKRKRRTKAEMEAARDEQSLNM